MSYSQLGSLLALTPAAVKYRINNLLTKGIIKRFTVEIDQQKLTPTYQSYFLRLSVHPGKVMNCVEALNSTRLCESIVRVATTYNLIVMTIPISNRDLKVLIEVIENHSVFEYNMAPILNRFPTVVNKEIVGENINNLYCPECQNSMSSDGFVDRIGEQVMGFCCKECRDSFKEKYSKISQ